MGLTENGKRKTENGERKTDDAEREQRANLFALCRAARKKSLRSRVNGKRKAENGERKTENGKLKKPHK